MPSMVATQRTNIVRIWGSNRLSLNCQVTRNPARHKPSARNGAFFESNNQDQSPTDAKLSAPDIPDSSTPRYASPCSITRRTTGPATDDP